MWSPRGTRKSTQQREDHPTTCFEVMRMYALASAAALTACPAGGKDVLVFVETWVDFRATIEKLKITLGHSRKGNLLPTSRASRQPPTPFFVNLFALRCQACFHWASLDGGVPIPHTLPAIFHLTPCTAIPVVPLQNASNMFVRPPRSTTIVRSEIYNDRPFGDPRRRSVRRSGRNKDTEFVHTSQGM